MAIIKCKMCGGDLELIPGSSVCECVYCGTKQTVPAADSDKKLSLFARANKLRAACEFDKAFGVFESIVAEFPDEAEAYWGLLLCQYGIEYVDDPATGRKIPTCHRSSFSCVQDDVNFEQALENANSEARQVYREEARVIEELRKGIVEVSSQEAPYDVFICYKETGLDGQRTKDSVLAHDIHRELTREGYRVFFSRITLEDKLGTEYEPYIFAALNSAKVMLVVGTNYEHFHAPWVKNEWSRYLKLMASDHSKHLIPCFKDMDPYDMPREFSKLQAQDLGKIGATQDLIRGVEKLLNKKQTIAQPVANDAVSTMLASAQTYVQLGDYDVAEKKFKELNDKHPQVGQAWWGRVVCATQGLVKTSVDISMLNKWMQNAKKTTKPADYTSMERKYVDYLQKVSALETEQEAEQLRRKAQSCRNQLEELGDKLQDIQNTEKSRVQQMAYDEAKATTDYRNARSMAAKGKRKKVLAIIKFILSIPFFFIACAGIAEDGISFSTIVIATILILIGKAFFTNARGTMDDAKRMLSAGQSNEISSQERLRRLSEQKVRDQERYENMLQENQKSREHTIRKLEACESYLKLDSNIRQSRCFAYNCRSIGVEQPINADVQRMFDATM